MGEYKKGGICIRASTSKKHPNQDVIENPGNKANTEKPEAST